jgi:hypothetical protein
LNIESQQSRCPRSTNRDGSGSDFVSTPLLDFQIEAATKELGLGFCALGIYCFSSLKTDAAMRAITEGLV